MKWFASSILFGASVSTSGMDSSGNTNDGRLPASPGVAISHSGHVELRRRRVHSSEAVARALSPFGLCGRRPQASQSLRLGPLRPPPWGTKMALRVVNDGKLSQRHLNELGRSAPKGR
jgi:hypothetical protein